MRYIFLIFTVFLFNNNSFAQISDRERACIKAENLAQKDMYNHEMKYYRFGLIMPDEQMYAQDKILKDQYNIEVIQLGCVVSDSILCYNSQIEKIVKRKYGPNFWKKVQQKAKDMINAEQKTSIDTVISKPFTPNGYEPTYVSIERAQKLGARKAILDHKEGRLVIHKYYKTVDSIDVNIMDKILQNQYGLKFAPITGVVHEETNGYRRQANKIAKEKYGDDFWHLLEKKVDSVRKSKNQ